MGNVPLVHRRRMWKTKAQALALSCDEKAEDERR
ncbi:hypothetical protein C8J45_10144 [Sphingomonas sp. PP-CE-3G-477]|jgi:hypothetical protein|nr:hypothetical protein C8J45_10144 [Sphingomonas sp. PP-CE-3G-477]